MTKRRWRFLMPEGRRRPALHYLVRDGRLACGRMITARTEATRSRRKATCRACWQAMIDALMEARRQ